MEILVHNIKHTPQQASIYHIGYLAALLCGIFLETWNYHSLAKWVYTVPFVHRFKIFEMPMLGYAGYLPLGLECVTVGLLLENLPRFSKKASRSPQGPVGSES